VAQVMRRAHTLMEMAVVMTLLSLLATLVVPRFIVAWGKVQGETALEMVQEDFAFARQRAIGTGMRHQLNLNPQTGEITVEVRRVDETTTGNARSVSENQVLTDRLPEEVKVVEWVVNPLTASTALTRSGATQAADAVVCYPEGRTDDATLIIEDRDGRRSGVRLDGFTGELRALTDEEMSK
jgi:Tfp pilus assembly protein FimT